MIDDYDLIVSSFQTQYGIRLSKEIHDMPWEEFSQFLYGISPDTPLGRIVSIRCENRKEILEQFTPEQHRIRNEWRRKNTERIKNSMTEKEMDEASETIKNNILQWLGYGGEC